MHRLIVIVDGVAAALGVPADELKGIPFPQGIVRSLRRVHIPGNGGHEIPEPGLPDLRGEQLYLAAGGWERVMVDVPALVGKGDAYGGILVAINASLFERLVVRQLRLLAPQVLVAPLQPLAQRAAFCELGPQADLLRHLAEPVVLEPALVHRLDDLVVEAHKVSVLPGLGDVLPLKHGNARQQHIGKLGAGGHKEVAAYDELALGGVPQDFRRAVDVSVLVDEAVARQVQNHLDVALQLLAAGDAVQFRQLVAPHHRLCPQVRGDLHGIGVGHVRHIHPGVLGAKAAAAGPAAGNAHVASHTGKQYAAPGPLLAVGMALGAESLHQRCGPGGGVADGQGADRLSRDAGDGRRPLRRFGHAVFLAGEVGKHTFRRVHPLGHVGLVKAQAAAVQEVLVLQALLHDHIGHGVLQRRVRGRPQGDPLGSQLLRRVVAAGVHHDDGDALLPGPAQIIHGLAVKLRLRRIVAPEDDKVAVEPVNEAVARLAGAVHQVCRLADAGGGIAVVIAKISAVQLQKALGKATAADGGADAGGIVYVAGAGAIGIPDAHPLPGNEVRGLLPADALEFPLAPLADPLHGVAEPVGAQKGLMIVQSPDAGAKGHVVPRRLGRVRG